MKIFFNLQIKSFISTIENLFSILYHTSMSNNRFQEFFQKFSQKLITMFFFGMIAQFIAHTIVMYGFNVPVSFEFIWLWKELIIALLWIWCLYLLYKDPIYRHKIKKRQIIISIILITIISFVISGINSIYIHDQDILTFLISAKFNYIPLIILSCWLLISQILTDDQYHSIIKMIVTSIKYVLIFSIIRYCIIHTIPNILDRIGFAQPGDSIEWTANTPPPSLYLTEFYSWYVRNQWPFWWPLSLGFYLAILWPLFFAEVLYQKKLSDTRWRRLLYISMVLSTYSRAARGMFFVSCVLITLIIYKKYTKYIIMWWTIIVLWIWIYIMSWWNSEMFIRTRSDKWHIEFFQQWVALVQQNWLWWIWASSVWPWASHTMWVKEIFNPENQYMQIRLEYWLLWLLSRITAYIIVAKNSIKKRYQLWTNHIICNQEDIIFIGIALSIISLSIGGIVLHPFTDSSSIYPFMLLAWLALWRYNTTTSSLPIIKRDSNNQQRKENNNNNNTKNNTVLSIRKTRTIVISLLFSIQTLLVSWREIVPNTVIISTIRDIIFISLTARTIRSYRAYIVIFIKKYYVISFSMLLLIGANLSYIIQHTQDDIIHIVAGIKYDIHFLIILVISLRYWYVLKQKNKWHIIELYITRSIKFIMVLILCCIIRQVTKTFYPDIFMQYLGFGMPNDFIPFSQPPIYYITWTWWIQRLSWLFVGPNTLWFFIILFSSLVYTNIRNYLSYRQKFFVFMCYILIALATLSRWVIIWITLQSLILLFFEEYIVWKRPVILPIYIKKKMLQWWIIVTISIISFLIINTRKDNSNTERFWALNTSLSLIWDTSLLGKWPWYVWPAQHYDKNYNLNQKNNLSMLENIYLQILINQWILGTLIFAASMMSLSYYHNNIRRKLQYTTTTPQDNNIYITAQYLWIWFISLLSIGWFLHIFIDSMVNYLFFVYYWITIWYSTADKNI
jgi:hypothetical protein